MKVSISKVELEYRRVEVLDKHVRRTLRDYAKRGWTLQGTLFLANGKAVLDFSRRSAGTVEVQP